MGQRRWVLVLFGVVITCACAGNSNEHYSIGSEPDGFGTPLQLTLMQKAKGNYNDAITIALPPANRGEAEYQQALAEIVLECRSRNLSDCRFSTEDAWGFYRAAAQKSDSIAHVLGGYYKYGGLGLKRNPDIGQCLQNLTPSRPASMCISGKRAENS